MATPGAFVLAALLGGPAPPAVAAPPVATPPGAFELLRSVERTHAGPGAYAVSGRLVAASGRQARFTTARDAGGAFRFEIAWQDGPRQVLWGTGPAGGGSAESGPEDGSEAAGVAENGDWFRFDAVAGAWWPVAAPLPELVALAGGGGVEALLVPALLAAGTDAVPPPEAAAVEGPEPCGSGPSGEPAATGSCWRLVLAWPRLEAHLLVATESHRVRQVETRPGAGGLEAAFADAGLLPDAEEAAPPGGVRVWLQETAGPPAGLAAFTPPAGAHRLEGPPAPEPGEAPQAVFGETVEVTLTTLRVRALDPSGEPIPGLGPDDFRVRLGRRRVPVQAVDFYSALPEHRLAGPLAEPGHGPDGAPAAAARITPAVEPPPRLVVLFVQADMHALRVRGHLKMLPFVERLLAELPPRDRVAVVSFDSHLKLWQDFTLDRDEAHAAVWDGIRFGGRPWPRSTQSVSLARRWDGRAAREAARPERALELVGDALAALPGEKAIVFLGWGLGRFGADGFKLQPDYGPAVAALERARAPVFVLDVADAAFHSLELGLRQVAGDTGGTYAKTAEFPASAVGRLAATLSSWYVLTVAMADLPEDCAGLSVELAGRRGQVLVGAARLPCYNPRP